LDTAPLSNRCWGYAFLLGIPSGQLLVATAGPCTTKWTTGVAT